MATLEDGSMSSEGGILPSQCAWALPHYRTCRKFQIVFGRRRRPPPQHKICCENQRVMEKNFMHLKKNRNFPVYLAYFAAPVPFYRCPFKYAAPSATQSSSRSHCRKGGTLGSVWYYDIFWLQYTLRNLQIKTGLVALSPTLIIFYNSSLPMYML